MKDILLDSSGDIKLTPGGDISIVESPIQEAMIRMKWFLNEWAFDPGKGMPWFEHVFIKNPNEQYIKKLLTDQVMSIESVISVPKMNIAVEKKSRTATIMFSMQTSEGTYDKEVTLHA